MKAVDSKIEEIDILLEAEVERLALIAFEKHPNIQYFLKAMGMAFFKISVFDEDGRYSGTESCDDLESFSPELDSLLAKYDGMFKITGEPLKILKDGTKIHNW